MDDHQLNLAIETAREAAARGDFATAVETQERVVAHVRLLGPTNVEDWVMLSAQMFNLADYYTGQERFAEAIRLLEEVVALDERLGLPDAESDRQMLDSVRRLVGMTPGERKQWYQDTPAGQPTVTAGPGGAGNSAGPGAASRRATARAGDYGDPAEPDEVTELLNQLDGVTSVDRAEVETLMRELMGLSPEEKLKKVMEARAKDEPDEKAA